jgi:hypothetical protein
MLNVGLEDGLVIGLFGVHIISASFGFYLHLVLISALAVITNTSEYLYILFGGRALYLAM